SINLENNRDLPSSTPDNVILWCCWRNHSSSGEEERHVDVLYQRCRPLLFQEEKWDRGEGTDQKVPHTITIRGTRTENSCRCYNLRIRNITRRITPQITVAR